MEKNKKTHILSYINMKTGALIVSLLFVFICCGFMVNSLTYDNSWTQYQNIPHSTGQYDYVISDFSYFGDSSIPAGSYYQPLDIDFNNDDLKETIIYSGNYIYILDYGGQPIYEYNMLTSPSSNPVIIIGDIVPPQNSFSVIMNNNNFVVTRHTGNVYNTSFVTSTDITSCTQWDGLRYDNLITGFGTSLVYGICYNASNTTHLVSLNPATFDITVYPSIGDVHITGASVGALDDINNYGATEYVFNCDYNKNGQYGLCVISTDTGGLSTYFNGNGVFDDLSGVINSTHYIHNPIVYNFDGSGDMEILSSYSLNKTTCSQIISLRSNGNIHWTSNGTAGGNVLWCNYPIYAQGKNSQPFIAKRNGIPIICTTRNGAGGAGSNAVTTIGCINGTTGKENMYYRLGNNITAMQNVNVKAGLSFANEQTTSFFADQTDNLVVGGYIFHVNKTGVMSLLYDFDRIEGDRSYYTYSASDYNNDGSVDISLTSYLSGYSYILYSSALGGITNPNAQWLDNITNGGIYGYYDGSPVCKGTTLTFGAYECPRIGGCSYTNEIFDYETERLVVNCGNGVITTGSLHLNNPTADCSYPNTGSFTARIYLQDQSHLSDTTEVQTIIINVIDGIPSQTCNIQSGFVSNPSQADTLPPPDDALQAETKKAVDYFFSVFTGGSAWLKLIIGIGLIIAILLMVAEYTSNGVVLLFSGILATILITALGFIPIYILILFIITMILIIIIMTFVASNKENG